MHWQESSKEEKYVAPDDIVDISYRIVCKCLPLEHAYELSQALAEYLPWLQTDPQSGVHLIHGAESGNGWQRPDDPTSELLYLSRRTRMSLRIPKERVDSAHGLSGVTLKIGDYPIEVGVATVKPLSTLSTLFSRYVVSDELQDEASFVDHQVEELRALGITVRKLMCGRSHRISTPDQVLFTRSVMLAELSPQDSVRLQQVGLGSHKYLGCGLFLAHKDIAPVNIAVDD